MNIASQLENLPTITMFDPLAKVLGAVTDGLLEYSYLDCVKLAGHSCRTVSSTYLAAKLAITTLYAGEPGVRGNIKVYLPEAKANGVTGVMANVLSLLTGASDEGGFKGLAGNFARNQRIVFSQTDLLADLRFERLDNGAVVDIKVDLQNLATPAKMPELMNKMMSGSASEQELVEFGQLWQTKVQALFNSSDDFITVAH